LTYNNFGYDNGGNQTTISPYTVSYDVENRQSGFTSTSNGSATYTYDGDGRRVEKTAGGVTTTYVYDATGNLAAEYSSQPPSMPCQTCYLTTDHLGSTRVITSQTGGLVSRHDFLPFGEELATGNRTAAQGYGVADNVMQRYTGQQRDLEGPVLDYFHARYFQGAQGRFTSPDPGNIAGIDHLDNPQDWNAYGYAGNNPLSYTDPDGLDYHVCVSDQNGNQQCTDVASDQAFQQAARNPGAGLSVSGDDGSGVIYSTDQNGNQIQVGTYQHFVGPGAEGGGLQQDFGTELFGAGIGVRLLDIGANLAGRVVSSFIRPAETAVGPQAAKAATQQVIELTEHGAVRLAQRGITKEMVKDAVKTAEESGAIKSNVGQYGSIQHVYQGSNGISVVVETEGRNAGKAITAFWTGSKP
jgi:RHS repeat-associated protein